MSQRFSEYDRKPNDLYETPAWVTEVLVSHLPSKVKRVWEPAAGGGCMVAALRRLGVHVESTDISGGVDFLASHDVPTFDAVITNPPFRLAQRFIERALDLTRPGRGAVAMLLGVDYDFAKTRQHLFGKCPMFAKKLVLTRRIVWVGMDGPGAAPSTNHAWFIWDHRHEGPPAVVYQGGALRGQAARAQAIRDRDEADRTDQRPRPSGNSIEAALRRLRKSRPDIHAQVLAGEITPHAGMIAAGFRKRPV